MPKHDFKLDRVSGNIQHFIDGDLHKVFSKNAILLDNNGQLLIVNHATELITAGNNIFVEGAPKTSQQDIKAALQKVFPNKATIGAGVVKTLDITGLTTIDLSSVADADIVNLTSTNATETVDSIIGATDNKTVRLQPESGLTVTFTGTAVADAAAGDIVLPTASFVANGTNRDYLSVVSDGDFVKQVDANNFI